MSLQVQAAIAYDIDGLLKIESIELADIRSDEVLVALDACGICHTDSKFRRRLPLPGVFGHEGTGRIIEKGSNVSEVNINDRVILSYPFCNNCPWCDISEPYRCENIPALKFGGQRLDGSKTISANGRTITSAFFQQSSFATHAIAREQALVRVNDETPAEILAALPCGVQTGAGAVMNFFKPNENDELLIIGAGAVGLSAVMAARIAGVKNILSVDINQQRLAIAKELGATKIYQAGDDVVKKIKKKFPRGVRYALDATATVPGLKTAIGAIGQGGIVGIVSYPNEGKNFPFNTKELFLKVGSLHTIIQGLSIPRLFLPKLLTLQQKGVFPIEKLITTYKFSDINRALEDAQSGNAIKPVLVMPG